MYNFLVYNGQISSMGYRRWCLMINWGGHDLHSLNSVMCLYGVIAIIIVTTASIKYIQPWVDVISVMIVLSELDLLGMGSGQKMGSALLKGQITNPQI